MRIQIRISLINPISSKLSSARAEDNKSYPRILSGARSATARRYDGHKNVMVGRINFVELL
jgi:hypothetical protein